MLELAPWWDVTVVDVRFLRLSENWALAYDKNQWIVQRRKAPGKTGGACRWAAVSFVGSNKDVLLRVLREKGAEIDPAARAHIDSMPEAFREWVSVPPERRFKAGHSAISGAVVGRGLPRHRSEAVTWQKTPHDIEADLQRARSPDS